MTNISQTVADEVLRQGELRLQAQLELALSADQRSMTFLGISGSAAIALSAASAAILTATDSNFSLGIAFLTSAITLFVSAIMAGFATKPIGFHIPGTRASLLSDAVKFDIAAIKMELSEVYEDRIQKNDKTLARNGKHMIRALIVALASVPVGAVAYVICLCPC